MKRSNGRVDGRGFTIFEVALVAVIITLLAALTFVAASRALNDPRGGVKVEAERLVLRAVTQGIDEFKNKMGGLPPLVNDATPFENLVLTINNQTVTTRRVGVRRGDNSTGALQNETLPGRFMRYEPNLPSGGPDEPRWSVLTPTVMLLGNLGRQWDGIDGPGMTLVNPATGEFSMQGAVTSLLFDATTVRERVSPTGQTAPAPGNEPLQVILDRWGTAIRYYRWLPTYHSNRANNGAQLSVYRGLFPDAGESDGYAYRDAPNNDNTRTGEVLSYNTPVAVGNAWDNPQLRGAQYAVVSAGPDKLFGDEPTTTIEQVLRVTGLNEKQLRTRAAADNVVEVGQ
jgi:hypothetical protein